MHSMGVTMVRVAHVFVRMLDRRVPMPVRMARAGYDRLAVVVRVVLVVRVKVFVPQRLVHVPMRVAFGRDQRHPERHGRARGDSSGTEVFAKERHGQECPEEWCGGEHNRFAGCAQEPKRVRVEHDPLWVKDGNLYTSAGIAAGIDLLKPSHELASGRRGDLATPKTLATHEI